MNEAAPPSRRRFLRSCAASALAAALPGEARAQARGMVFRATNACDLGLEAVEWTRRWIAEHGDEPLKK